MVLLFIGAALIVYDSAQGTGPSLETRDFTRGLIAVMLLTCTVAVVMVVTPASITSDDGSREKIVAAGTEILAPVIAILGTIVRFYIRQFEHGGFGQQEQRLDCECESRAGPRRRTAGHEPATGRTGCQVLRPAVIASASDPECFRSLAS